MADMYTEHKKVILGTQFHPKMYSTLLAPRQAGQYAVNYLPALLRVVHACLGANHHPLQASELPTTAVNVSSCRW